MWLWFEFIACSALIVVGGANLAKYGDTIAEKTGIGRAWIGLILMASVTSLPELIIGISSVTLAGVPNIALGDVMGSCVYNLAILAFMDALYGSKSLYQGAGRGHILSAGFSVVLLGIVVCSMLLGSAVPSIAHVGLYTPLIIIVYILGIRAVYYYELGAIGEFVGEAAEELQYKDISIKRAWILFGVNAVVIMITATILPFVAEGIAEQSGLGNTFVGSIFVAMTTSLPELVVSFAALRLGAKEMAIANMLGSNMFNILVLAVDDILFTTGPLFSYISPAHAVTGLIAVLMTAVVIIALTYPPVKNAFARLSWSSITLAALWVLSIVILYSGAGS